MSAGKVLNESKSRVEAPIDGTPASAFQILDADWRLTYMSPEARSIFAAHGYNPDEMIGRHFWDDLFPDARGSAIHRQIGRAMSERVPVAFEAYYPTWGRWHRGQFDPLPGGGLANHFRDITDEKIAEQALADSQRTLASELAAMARLQEVSTRLVRVEDSTSLLQEIVDAAIAITGADMGHVQLLDRRSGRLRIVASRGFDASFLDHFASVGDDQAACGAVLRDAVRVVVEDLRISPEFAGTSDIDLLLRAGALAVQATPLVSRSGRLVGVLSTHYRVPRRPGERDLRLVDLLSRQAADWIERTQAEEDLRKSEERFRRYFDLGLIGMALSAPSKSCLEVNDRLCEILGYGRDELLSITWDKITHPDDLAADVAQFDRVLAGAIDGYSIDKRWIRKDGRVIATTISVNAVRREDRSVDYFVSVVEDITERTRAEDALRRSRDDMERRVLERTAELHERAEQLARMASELTLAEQRERRRLSHVLHDHLQQLMVAMRLELETLARRLKEGLASTVDRVACLLDECLEASRSLSVELSPPILSEGGLEAGLRWLARWMAEKHGLRVTVAIDPKAAPEREDVRVLVFQSVREALFNVVKHAGVSEARVEAQAPEGNLLRVVVSDQGRGFDAESVAARDSVEAGLGLFGIRERLNLLGGGMEIDTAPGRGTRLALFAPIDHGAPHEPDFPVPAGARGLRGPAASIAPAAGLPYIRVLVADDHDVLRQGITALLAHEPDILVVGQASNGLEAVAKARELLVDVVLMDFSMPGMDGLEATRILHAEQPDLRIIGLSMYEAEDRAAAMLDAGAVGYVAKSEKSETLLAAIRARSAWHRILPPWSPGSFVASAAHDLPRSA